MEDKGSVGGNVLFLSHAVGGQDEGGGAHTCMCLYTCTFDLGPRTRISIGSDRPAPSHLRPGGLPFLPLPGQGLLPEPDGLHDERPSGGDGLGGEERGGHGQDDAGRHEPVGECPWHDPGGLLDRGEEEGEERRLGNRGRLECGTVKPFRTRRAHSPRFYAFMPTSISVPGGGLSSLILVWHSQVGRNICHGSDSVENAEREIKLWFGEGTIDWSSHSQGWIYE